MQQTPGDVRSPGRTCGTSLPSAFRFTLPIVAMLLWAIQPLPASAAPPLTDAQRRQLSTARDGGAFDEGALYPLLRNAAKWKPTDEREARVPDYQRIQHQPARHRGQVYLIEGVFVRQRMWSLARSNPNIWGRRLVQWVVKTSADPQDVRVIFLVDPDQSMVGHAPRPGRKVRLAARFYKVWTQQQDTTAVSFLTFIAPGATPAQAPGRYLDSANKHAGSSAKPLVPTTTRTALLVIIVLLTGLAFVLYRLRSLTSRSRSPTSRRSTPRHAQGLSENAPTETEEPQPRSDLPQNPADAMSVLHTEHDKDAENHDHDEREKTK